MQKKRNLRLFYLHETLFQFGENMLALLFPIFLYTLFNHVSAFFIFDFFLHIIYLSTFVPFFNKAMTWGKPKYFMVAGVILDVGVMIFLGKTDSEHLYFLVPVVVLFGVYCSCYWMVRHWFFSVNADHENVGKQTSFLEIIRILVAFLAPIAGGWISFTFSFNAAFLLGASITFLSIVPILFFEAPPHPRGYDWKKIFGILQKPELKSIRPAYFWEGIHEYLVSSPWILAFAIFIGTIKQLGFLVGLSTLVAAGLTWLAGHFFDKRKRAVWLGRLTLLKTAGNLLYASIFLFPSWFYIWAVELYNRFSSNMHQTFVSSYLYAYSAKIHPIHFHWNREVYLGIARLIASGSLAILFFWLPAKFLWMFIAVGAFTSFGWLSLKKSDHLLG